MGLKRIQMSTNSPMSEFLYDSDRTDRYWEPSTRVSTEPGLDYEFLEAEIVQSALGSSPRDAWSAQSDLGVRMPDSF